MKKGVREVCRRAMAAVLSVVMIFGLAVVNIPLTVHAAVTTEKIANSEIASAEAKTVGPSGDGHDIWASFDGDTTTYTNSNYGDPANGKPQVYTIVFNTNVKLNKVRIHPRSVGSNIGNGAPDTCTVEVSADGSAYTEVITAAVTDTELTWTDIEFPAVDTKAVKLTINSKHEAVVSTGEVEFYKEVSDEPVALDYTVIDKAIADAEAKAEEDYTADSWAAMQAALLAAQTAKANAETQDEINNAAAALTDAVNALVSANVDARTALKNAIARADATAKKGSDYVGYSADANRILKALYTCATTIDKNTAVASEAAAAIAEALNAALDGKEDQTTDVYRDQIQKLVVVVNSIYKMGDYTFTIDSSVASALSDAEKKLSDPESTINKLSWSEYYLANAVKSLSTETNKLSDLEKEIYQIIVEAGNIDTSVYTADSWAAYEKACTSARGKVNGNFNDTEMQKVLDELKALKEALVKVDPNLVTLKKLAEEMGAVVYEDYTRETWRAFKNAIYNVEVKLRENTTTIEEDEFNTLKTAVETAYAGLVKGTEGTEYGEHLRDPLANPVDVWKTKETNWNTKGGQLYVSKEAANSDGTTTLTVTWVNDGLDPEYGGLMHNVGIFNKEEWTTREFSADDWTYVKWLSAVVVSEDSQKTLRWDAESTEPVERIEECNGFPEEMRAGFTKEITVPTGAVVTLELGGYDNARIPARTYSLGAYHTESADRIAPVVAVAVDAGKKAATVTLSANEPIQDVEGWTRVDETTLKKEYTENGTYKVTVADIAGNETVVTFEVVLKSDQLYADVPNDPGWRYDAIEFVTDNGIMNGISGTENFDPDGLLKREMFATIVYRMEGSPAATYDGRFPDVKDPNYYVKPISWASAKGIITGHSNTGLFGVHEDITREDLVVIMYRYARVKGYNTGGGANLEKFPDAGNISGYAVDAVKWAVGNGIINGRSNTGLLDPKGNASRVEAAAIVQRFMQKYVK